MSTHPFDTPLCQRIGHTLPGRVAVFAEHWPERIALREKGRGLWRAFSWRDYQDEVLAVAEALRMRGLAPGERIAILSDNRTEWLFADLGAQALGLLSAGIYTTNPAADVAYVLNHCRATLIVVEDQEQADKVLESPEPLPHLRTIVVIDPKGLRDYHDARLVTWEDFIAPGRIAARARSAGAVHQQLEALDADRPATVIYTSGTTARPKGVLLSSRNMLGLSDTTRTLFQATERDTLLSYLPLCHVAEKIFTQFIPLTAGCTVHFGESLDTVRQDLAEVAPTIFLGVPRIWEKMHAGVDIALRNSTPLKRHLYYWALAQGLQRADRGGAETAASRLADWLVLRALRERLGLGRVRLPVSGAAPIAPELLRWFHAIGVPILEGYGLSESSGVSHMNLPGDCVLGSVGRPVPGTEFRLADDGEILLRGSHVFLGYLDNPEATAEAIDGEGWFHTGDLGQVEAGRLSIVGRKKEILITAGGKNLSPTKIENALKTSPYIKEACAIADGRAYVGALIQIEAELTGDWATRQGLAFTSFEDLAAKPEVVKWIGDEVARINEALLARVEQVRTFRLLPKELHQEDGEVTATQKIKRRVLNDKFAGLIDAMYRKPT